MVRGRVWRFGDDISTDLLSPGSYATEPIEVRRLHALESVNASFASGVRAGDVVVAGRNFGCGSSRETAPEALKSLDVGCVVAESFARLFLRNAVAIGLPVLTCAGAAHAFSDGEEVEVNLATGGVRSKVGGADLAGNPLPEEMRRILAAGGILALLRAGSADETHSSHAPKES
ncbi:MAG: 3-isopropylmalate dehydratase [Acidobacteria bacterium]|nr:3-isopropylmalate dehydratase [Acidobacteriota bacterium]